MQNLKNPYLLISIGNIYRNLYNQLKYLYSQKFADADNKIENESEKNRIQKRYFSNKMKSIFNINWENGILHCACILKWHTSRAKQKHFYPVMKNTSLEGLRHNAKIYFDKY